MSKSSQREAPVVEPPTTGPAIDDPATTRALTALRAPLLVLPLATVALGVPAILLAVADAGWPGIAVLTIAALAFLITAMLAIWLSGRWIGPAGRLLRAEPWRRASVQVFRAGRRGLPRATLLVREDGKPPLRLVATALPWAAQQVLARTGTVWLVGPDDRGWAAVRAPGLALPLGQAQVVPGESRGENEITVEQTAPVRIPLAAGDAVLSRVIAAPRKRSRTDVVAPGLLFLFAVVVTVDLIRRGVQSDQVVLAVCTFAGTLAIAGYLAWRVGKLRYWIKADRLLAAGPWTPVKADFPKPAKVGKVTVTGRATLPGGDTVGVTLPRAGHALRSNIAATGTLWVAGQPGPGKPAAVGIPGYPFLNIATFDSK
ncbi:hypothetical protein [Actinokineospora enzanensis]|uniref:hypothetical protein n=1 Tax=Actinokineospora enzanensis TaxID=155975 RepID=UPI0003670EC7|nr:hypothetical protein [Actinokineospora enzanensis]